MTKYIFTHTILLVYYPNKDIMGIASHLKSCLSLATEIGK